MSLNLVLTDKKSKESYNLYQTPTDVTRACLAAGNTAGILAKYIEYVETLGLSVDSSYADVQTRAIGKAWEYVGLHNIEFDDAFKLAVSELVTEENSVYREHLDNLHEFLATHPNATFGMV